MTKWMTSGAARLKANLNRSFFARKKRNDIVTSKGNDIIASGRIGDARQRNKARQARNTSSVITSKSANDGKPNIISSSKNSRSNCQAKKHSKTIRRTDGLTGYTSTMGSRMLCNSTGAHLDADSFMPPFPQELAPATSRVIPPTKDKSALLASRGTTAADRSATVEQAPFQQAEFFQADSIERIVAQQEQRQALARQREQLSQTEANRAAIYAGGSGLGSSRYSQSSGLVAFSGASLASPASGFVANLRGLHSTSSLVEESLANQQTTMSGGDVAALAFAEREYLDRIVHLQQISNEDLIQHAAELQNAHTSTKSLVPEENIMEAQMLRGGLQRFQGCAADQTTATVRRKSSGGPSPTMHNDQDASPLSPQSDGVMLDSDVATKQPLIALRFFNNGVEVDINGNPLYVNETVSPRVATNKPKMSPVLHGNVCQDQPNASVMTSQAPTEPSMDPDACPQSLANNPTEVGETHTNRSSPQGNCPASEELGHLPTKSAYKVQKKSRKKKRRRKCSLKKKSLKSLDASLDGVMASSSGQGDLAAGKRKTPESSAKSTGSNDPLLPSSNSSSSGPIKKRRISKQLNSMSRKMDRSKSNASAGPHGDLLNQLFA
mmetsp:Transcript_39973/g.83957  ORF Transcript_39973/g.83957 Transcript_39973/m.83957 type:complete len:609 (+) Transcript_39973:186-2012(+)|eukprot:CAMPEP_0183729234 /NCGR_PEP_ID=MMETSP0737-20130205/29970_1 /TAXON_ID=385413 /ORGANISM="Thalassiosira miniscula, Strain CCMP1093" /LENGTH=608 /DNA_ID=CAMNT_0025961381 /DNA_START=98 /DNA_END=1924 /DNA_ORIENTATION=-